MHKPRENPGLISAGIFSLSVHAALIMVLFMSFNWKTAQPMNVAEVTLWESVPQPVVATPPPAPEVEPLPKVVDTPVVEPEPQPVIEEKIIEEKVEDMRESEIALEKKREEKKKQAQEKAEAVAKKAQELEKKKILDALKNEVSRERPIKESDHKAQKDALKKLQQEALADEKSASDKQASAASAVSNASAITEYQNKIRNKIRGNVNKTLCGSGNPELKFEIGLLPTGQLSGSPQLVKSSGSEACDEAVERAIVASEPLPLPSEAGLFAQFKNLKLTFRPND